MLIIPGCSSSIKTTATTPTRINILFLSILAGPFQYEVSNHLKEHHKDCLYQRREDKNVYLELQCPEWIGIIGAEIQTLEGKHELCIRVPYNI